MKQVPGDDHILQTKIGMVKYHGQAFSTRVDIRYALDTLRDFSCAITFLPFIERQLNGLKRRVFTGKKVRSF